MTDSPVPVDVFSRDELESVGVSADLTDVISKLVPSFNVGRESISDGASGTSRGGRYDLALPGGSGVTPYEASLVEVDTDGDGVADRFGPDVFTEVRGADGRLLSLVSGADGFPDDSSPRFREQGPPPLRRSNGLAGPNRRRYRPITAPALLRWLSGPTTSSHLNVMDGALLYPAPVRAASTGTGLAAPGLSRLAASNHSATSSGPTRSRSMVPKAGRMRALR